MASCWIVLIALLLSGPWLGSVAHAEEEGAEAPVLEAESGDAVETEAGDVAVADPTVREGVEEITVTAQRREQSIQDVPVAVSAFSGADLDDAGIYQMQDLAFQVPNMHYGQEQGTARITIRGVSTGMLADQATAFHVDGVYQNDPRIATALTFYDVQRVEVLRGPQGTLYGRNATGGAINVISAPPSFGFDLFGDVQVGTYHQVLARGVVNLPVVEDMVALRLSGFYDRRDGYQKNSVVPGSADDYDDADDFGLRAQMLVQPSEDLEVTLRFNYFKKGGVGFALKMESPYPDEVDIFPNFFPFPLYRGATPNPRDKRRVNLDTAGAIDQENIGGNLELQYHLENVPALGPAQLKVIGSYVERDTYQRSDQDGSDLPIAQLDAFDYNREWVAEANLTSQGDGRWDWVMGVFTFGTQATIDVYLPVNIRLPDALGAIVVPLDTETHFQLNSYSVAGFGQVGYHITDQLRLEAGLRYSHDWKDAGRQNPLIELPLPNPFPPLPIFKPVDDADQGNWGRVSGMVGMDYTLPGDHLLYGKFSTGYKAGAAQNVIPVVGGGLAGRPELFVPPDVGPEDIFALEFGLKANLLDDRLRTNISIFNYWYSDLQVSQLVESWFVLENAADARTFGAEAELLYMPWDDLVLIATFSYLDAKFLSFPSCISAEDPFNTRDCTGNVLPRSPRFTGSFVAQYDFDLGRYGVLTPRVQVFASDRVYFRATNLEVDLQPAYALLNLRLMWRSVGERLSVELFVDNLTDEDVATTKVVGSSLLGAPLYTSYDRPRTAGIRVGLDW